jgi:cytoplasmic iron level regulating protein YaaA (DUF328/UPF0246 family)
VQSVEGLKAFNTSGYQFDAEASEGNTIVFLRAEQK